MLERGVPIEAIVTELVLSGEVERTYRIVRLEGGAAQMAYHSPTSQYGQMSRADAFAHLDIAATMRELVEEIASGRFADEWDAERDAGYPRLEALRAKAMAPEILAFEADLRSKLGERAVHEVIPQLAARFDRRPLSQSLVGHEGVRPAGLAAERPACGNRRRRRDAGNDVHHERGAAELHRVGDRAVRRGGLNDHEGRSPPGAEITMRKRVPARNV